MQHGILDTDGYKFSMAEAGAALRAETFHYTHRKGGWQVLPVDVAATVRAALPVASDDAWAFLDSHGYRLGGAYRAAIAQTDRIAVDGLPRGAWFWDREPVFSVTGPSALVSWLEPLVLQLHYRIQVATAAFRDALPEAPVFTCAREAELYAEAVDDAAALGARFRRPASGRIDPEAYHAAVLARAKALVAIVGDPDRLFEVGMRACSCIDQHRIALDAVAGAGIRRTSNVALARELGLVPVGTMGHEHVQRHGSDAAAFAAMRDRYPGFVFYLPDTFDTLGSGVPAAIAAMREDPRRDSGIRFDSEHDIESHWTRTVAMCRSAGLEPVLGLESGWDDALTRRFEALREAHGWPARRQGYGLGGYLVNPPWPTFRRDDVAAVWKISATGGRPTMKFGDEPHGGKSSIPGRPVVWRSRAADGPTGYVAQAGEPLPAGLDAFVATGAALDGPGPSPARSGVTAPSAETRRLVDRCVAERDAMLRGAP